VEGSFDDHMLYNIVGQYCWEDPIILIYGCMTPIWRDMGIWWRNM